MPTTLPLRDGCFHVSGSELSSFTKCPREYYYNRVLRRETVECKVGRTYGGIIHKALATHPADQAQLLEKEFAACDIPLDDYRNLDFATGQLAAYYKKYKTEPFTIAKLANGYFAREVVFAEPLATITFNGQAIPVIWRGTIDAIITWPNGQVEHLDYKTTSVGGKGYFDAYYNNTSQLGYCWALNQMGFPSRGFLMDVLIGRRPTPTGVCYEFMRQRFPVDEAQLVEWKDNVIAIAQKMLYAFHTTFDAHRRSCKSQFGRCDYFSLCSYASDVRNTIITGDGFKPVTEYSTYAEI